MYPWVRVRVTALGSTLCCAHPRHLGPNQLFFRHCSPVQDLYPASHSSQLCNLPCALASLSSTLSQFPSNLLGLALRLGSLSLRLWVPLFCHPIYPCAVCTLIGPREFPLVCAHLRPCPLSLIILCNTFAHLLAVHFHSAQSRKTLSVIISLEYQHRTLIVICFCMCAVSAL